MTENEVARIIVDTALRVHRLLGPGLLENVYSSTLARALDQRSLKVSKEVAMPVDFDGLHFDIGFRADLLVEDSVIVEVKSVTEILAVHRKQLSTYLRLGNKRLGLLINFNVVLLKDGITRIANGIDDI
jgi:GxxExxY protein